MSVSLSLRVTSVDSWLVCKMLEPRMIDYGAQINRLMAPYFNCVAHLNILHTSDFTRCPNSVLMMLGYLNIDLIKIDSKPRELQAKWICTQTMSFGITDVVLCELLNCSVQKFGFLQTMTPSSSTNMNSEVRQFHRSYASDQINIQYLLIVAWHRDLLVLLSAWYQNKKRISLANTIKIHLKDELSEQLPF
jgi:hypothetical protein